MKSDKEKVSQKSAYNLNEQTTSLINKLQAECFDLLTTTPPQDTLAFYKQQAIRMLVSNRFVSKEKKKLIALEKDFMRSLTDAELKLPVLDPLKEHTWDEEQRHKALVLRIRKERVHLILRDKFVLYVDALMLLMRKYGIDLRDETIKEKLG